MSRIAYVNGQYLPLSDARVGIEDRGFQFGDGVYEVVHLHRGVPVDEARHMARLERSLRELRLVLPVAPAALGVVLREVARRNRLVDGLLYAQVTRGAARRDHAFPPPTPPTLVVTGRRMPPFPADVDAWAARAVTRPDERWARCDIKSVNLLPNVLARQAAREAGAVEAILVDADGMVTEGASTTVWIVDAGGVLRTRHLDRHVLPGCTRMALLEVLPPGQRAEELAFSAAELRAAREVFLTSATSFVRPIVAIDGAAVGEGRVGPVSRALFAAYTGHLEAARRAGCAGAKRR